MRTVPREVFVDDERGAYADRPFERFGTRVLSPSTAARMIEALDPTEGEDVLVVGVGVGYTAAVVAELVGEANVHAIDIARRLVLDARSNLSTAGYGGVPSTAATAPTACRSTPPTTASCSKPPPSNHPGARPSISPTTADW